MTKVRVVLGMALCIISIAGQLFEQAKDKASGWHAQYVTQIQHRAEYRHGVTVHFDPRPAASNVWAFATKPAWHRKMNL